MGEDRIRTTDSIPCPRCGGTGRVERFGGGERDCYSCYGAGAWPTLESQAEDIAARITNKGRLRKTRPIDHKKGDDAATRIAKDRAYYIWRLARFHGGADVTMPVVATMMSEHDPERKRLDVLADVVARKAFGTDRAAAYRWAAALGRDVRVPEGMPASAYPGGPVHDGNDLHTTLMMEVERRCPEGVDEDGRDEVEVAMGLLENLPDGEVE